MLYFLSKDKKVAIMVMSSGKVVELYPLHIEEEEKSVVADLPQKRVTTQGRMLKTKPVAQQTNEIKKAIRSGTPSTEIARKFGKSLATIHVLKSNMKKNGELSITDSLKTSETFTVRTPEDGRTQMIQKYGKTSINQVLDMYLVGNDVDKISKAVDLSEKQVDEILDQCV